MEAVEQLLVSFSNESIFTQCVNEETLSSFIDDVGRKLAHLDMQTRNELLNSLYYNTQSSGYSSLLHLCFKYMTTNDTFKYALWRAIYIFCELGLDPLNATYLPLQQIKLRSSMRESLNSLIQIHEENEMKDIQSHILNLKSHESNRSQRSSISTPSSCDFNIGDVNDMFQDKDIIILQQKKPQQTPPNLRISPFDSKLKTQPRSWIDLQLNDDNTTTKHNIITVLSYAIYHHHRSPPIFTMYHHSASCCTILGNAFVSLKQFDPNTLMFALCKLHASKIISVVDDISYYDHLKMKKYEIDLQESVQSLKYNIHALYKQEASQRRDHYLCYLYLIRHFYNKFRNDSYRRFMEIIPLDVHLNDMILDTIQMYTFDDLSYCDAYIIGEQVENKWLCIWFDSLNNDNVYSEQWMLWVSKYILKRLSDTQKEYLSIYLSSRRRLFIKHCANYRLKCSMLDILAKKLKHDNSITSYINPKWFLNNVVLKDTLLVQKVLIHCLNSTNYKDLCVTALWSLLTNASFGIQSRFFDEIIDIIKKFSHNNIYFVNGCCQNVLDSIFSLRQSFLEENIFAQKNVTTFLLYMADKERNGELSVDINKGLLQCVISMPVNVILLKILVMNEDLVDFNACLQRGIIDHIQSQLQYIQNVAIRDIFVSWYRYNTKQYQSQLISESPSVSNTTVSLPPLNDERCILM